MNLTVRLVDYGIIGGIFFAFQLAIIWAFVPFDAVLLDMAAKPEAIWEQLPEFAKPFISSVLASLGVLSVFVAGLLIDLISPVIAASIIIKTFRRHLQYNKEWLENLAKNHSAYFGRDYESLLRNYEYLDSSVTRYNPMMLLKWKKYWKTQIEAPHLVARFQDFMFSYALSFSQVKDATILLDQMRVWKVSSGIAVSLFLILVEYGILLYLYPEDYALFRNIHAPGGVYFGLFVVVTVPIAIVVLMYFVAVRTYSRMCYTLFALSYMAAKQQQT